MPPTLRVVVAHWVAVGVARVAMGPLSLFLGTLMAGGAMVSVCLWEVCAQEADAV